MNNESTNNVRTIRIDDELWDKFLEVLSRDDIKPSFAIRLFVRMVGNGTLSVNPPAIMVNNSPIIEFGNHNK